jgi:hypothetical protein
MIFHYQKHTVLNYCCRTGPPCCELILGLLKRSTNTSSEHLPCFSSSLSLSISLTIVLSFCLPISLYLFLSARFFSFSPSISPYLLFFLSLSHISSSRSVYLAISPSFVCLCPLFSLPVCLAISPSFCLSLSLISFSLLIHLSTSVPPFSVTHISLYLVYSLYLVLYVSLSYYIFYLSAYLSHYISSTCLYVSLNLFLAVGKS